MILDAQGSRRVAQKETGLEGYQGLRELQNGFRLNLLWEPAVEFVWRMFVSSLILALHEVQNRLILSRTSHGT